MKILLLNQFFWPDSSATSQLLTDLARALVKQGHDVTVVCSDAGGYAVAADELDQPTAAVFRVRALPFMRGKLGRLVSYLSFYVSGALRSLSLPRQDLVLSLTTPPLLSLVGTLVKKVRGSQHFIWEMDLYPDVAVDLGYFKAGGVADWLVGKLADYARRSADGVIALGECMRERLERRGVPPDLVQVAANWADGSAIQPLPRPGDPSELVMLYSGNLGLAHDLDTLSAAMVALKDDTRFRFLFVGGGGRRATLEHLVCDAELKRVELRPYVQRSSLGESLSLGDIGVVTQQAACCGSVVPSKVYGLLAAGRPILFIGPVAATPARVIKQFGCGWHIQNGDSEGLAELLVRLADDPDTVLQAGRQARAALVNFFDLPHGTRRIMGILGAIDATHDLSESTELPLTYLPAADLLGISH